MRFFSLFKGYLTLQLEEKGKQFERSAKSNKEAADIKYKVGCRRKTDHQKVSEVDQNC